MTTMTLDKQQSVYMLTLTNGQQDNGLSCDVLDEYNVVFDEIENDTHGASLIIRSDHPKTFCNGIDLNWLIQQSAADKNAFLTQLENTFIRLALLDLPVIAAINGNAYAGGAILACACDFRFMRADKGRFCLPEVNINIPFTPAVMDIVNLLPNPHTVQNLALTGKAMTGADCLANHIVDQLTAPDELMIKTLQFAEDMALKNRLTYAICKHQLRRQIVNLAKARSLYNAQKYAHPFIH